VVYKNGKHGFINSVGQLFVPLMYDNVGSFKEDLAVVARGASAGAEMGYIGLDGKVALPFAYEAANDFSNGLALVKKKGESDFCYIDKSGQVIVRLADYNTILAYSEGLAPVRQDGKWGFIDSSGEQAIACEYEWLDEGGFKGGLAMMKKDDKWGYIDKTGRAAVPFAYDVLYNFAGGYAAAIQDGKFGIIDTEGRAAVPFEYEFIGYIGDGLAFMQKDGKWGIIEINP
jgi:hypothetical protein